MSLNGSAYIVGAYEHPTRKADDLSVVRLHADVARGALEDAGLSKADIDGYFCAGDAPGLGATTMAEYLGLKLRHVDSTECGGSAPILHVAHAAEAIAAGRCNVALITLAGRPRAQMAAAASGQRGDHDGAGSGDFDRIHLAEVLELLMYPRAIFLDREQRQHFFDHRAVERPIDLLCQSPEDDQSRALTANNDGNVSSKALFLKKPIDAGNFDYDLFFVPTGSGFFELRSHPGGGSHTLPRLITATQDMFHTTSETWLDRTADLLVDPHRRGAAIHQNRAAARAAAARRTSRRARRCDVP